MDTSHEALVKTFLGAEYADYIISDAPSNLRGIQTEMEDGMDAESGDIFDTLAALELNDGYWDDSANPPNRLDECNIYNVMHTDRWFAYTPKTTGHNGCQLEASYAPTAQATGAKATEAAGLNREAYHRAQARFQHERAIFCLTDIINRKPDGRTKQGKVAKNLRALNRKLAVYDAKLAKLETK